MSRPPIHAAYIDKPATIFYRLDGDHLEPVGLLITSGTTVSGALTYSSLVNVPSGVEAAAEGANEFSGAMVSLISDHQIPAESGVSHLIEWEQTEYDVGGWVEGPTSSGLQFKVPENTNWVEITLTITWDDNSGGNRFICNFQNGAPFTGMPAQKQDAGADMIQTAHSAVIPVTPGDRFETRVDHSSGGIRDIIAGASTYWSIQRTR